MIRSTGWTPFSHACLLGLMLHLVGCGESEDALPSRTGPVIKVVYSGSPLADVQVSVFVDAEATRPFLRGVTGNDGQATLTSTDGSEVIDTNDYGSRPTWPITLESLSDGGWMLDTKLTRLSRESPKVEFNASGNPIVLELPPGSVRPL